MSNKSKVKFIRKNGRVIPVKGKGNGPKSKSPKKKRSSGKSHNNQKKKIMTVIGAGMGISTGLLNAGMTKGSFSKRGIAGGLIGGLLGLGVASVTNNNSKNR